MCVRNLKVAKDLREQTGPDVLTAVYWYGHMPSIRMA